MRRIVLLLIAVLAMGCSKNEDKQEDFSQYKLNVPEWLVGRWEYKEYLIDYSFEFTKMIIEYLKIVILRLNNHD